jgi:cyclopropane fatty-acyl-phospholipid synthase-like methyltransferase
MLARVASRYGASATGCTLSRQQPAFATTQYFRKAFALLKPQGLFLNHGITKPAGRSPAAHGVFIAREGSRAEMCQAVRPGNE